MYGTEKEEMELELEKLREKAPDWSYDIPSQTVCRPPSWFWCFFLLVIFSGVWFLILKALF